MRMIRGANVPPPGAPSYPGRQPYDIRPGARTRWSRPLMKAVVAKLTNQDFVAITAYVASRTP